MSPVLPIKRKFIECLGDDQRCDRRFDSGKTFLVPGEISILSLKPLAEKFCFRGSTPAREGTGEGMKVDLSQIANMQKVGGARVTFGSGGFKFKIFSVSSLL